MMASTWDRRPGGVVTSVVDWREGGANGSSGDSDGEEEMWRR